MTNHALTPRLGDHDRIRLAFQELYDQPTPDAATVFLKKWYLLGNPQPAAANHRCRAHCQAPLERHPALVPQQDSQWPHRGDQQPRPSRQSKGSRLPLSPQPQSHGLPARSQTQSHASKLRSLLPMPNSEEPFFFSTILQLSHQGSFRLSELSNCLPICGARLHAFAACSISDCTIRGDDRSDALVIWHHPSLRHLVVDYMQRPA